MTKNRRVGACARCARQAELWGRNLCSSCYYKLRRVGQLEAFPATELLPPEQRLAQLSRLGPDVCWPWPTRINQDGYGWAGHQAPAHRWVWARFNGPIPDGLEIDHICHNDDDACLGGKTCLHRRCVNPAHLRAVTHHVNGLASRHTLTGANVRKTHCPQGHPYDETNTYLAPCSGRRQCWTCMRQRNAHRASRAKDGA